MTRITIPAIILTLCLFSVSCGKMREAEQAQAMEEAALIEGRNVAKRYLDSHWPDSASRQADMAIVDSLSRQQPDSATRRAFMKGFHTTLRTVRPDLYRPQE